MLEFRPSFARSNDFQKKPKNLDFYVKSPNCWPIFKISRDFFLNLRFGYGPQNIAKLQSLYINIFVSIEKKILHSFMFLGKIMKKPSY